MRDGAAAGPRVELTSGDERTLRLRDGRTVSVRPVRPADAERLRAFDGRLSDASRSFRYLGWIPRLSPEGALAMATVDFRESFALVATAHPEADEHIVADRRLASDLPGTADIAVAVAEDCQDVGLGPAMIRLVLAVAAGAGLGTVVAQVREDNLHMIHVLRCLGFRRTGEELGVITFAAHAAA